MEELTKDIQQAVKDVELEIIKQFVSVCEEYSLKYYLMGGTMLGAIRHHGFIPWDDDIDVGMPRSDYEKFLERAHDAIKPPYFLQNVYTEKSYPGIHSKIRNSNTTFIESTSRKLNINHGIFIDIFPLDYYPEDVESQNKIDRSIQSMNRRISDFYYTFNTKQSIKRRIIGLFDLVKHPDARATLLERENVIKSVKESKLIINWGGAWGKKEIVPTEWYGDGADAVFEGIHVKVPSDYDKWLKQVYGNYMQLPPEEKRVTHHFTEVIDPYKPYTYYGGKYGVNARK